MSIFKGLSAFPITPCDADGKLVESDFRTLLDRLIAADVQSIGILGSTGLYPFHTRDTRRQAIAIARDQIGDAKPLIVGVGALRTDDAIALTQDAAAEGADGLLLAPVSYTPLLEPEVFAHFEAVAEASDRPICIYNNPGTTHFTFSTELLCQIGAIPNVKGVKMPLPADMADIGPLRAALPVDVALGYSGDWGCADCLLGGGEAWYSVIAGYLPLETALLARAAENGDTDEVARITKAFAPMWNLFKTWGSLRVIYTVAKLEGVSNAVLPRPLLPLPEDLHDAVTTAFASARDI